MDYKPTCYNTRRAPPCVRPFFRDVFFSLVEDVLDWQPRIDYLINRLIMVNEFPVRLIYPLVMTDIAVENHHVKWKKLSINYKWSFSIAMLNYQRVLFEKQTSNIAFLNIRRISSVCVCVSILISWKKKKKQQNPSVPYTVQFDALFGRSKECFNLLVNTAKQACQSIRLSFIKP